MKRFSAIFLCAAMLLSMAACRQDAHPSPTQPDDPTTATQAAQSALAEDLETMGAAAGYENAFSELTQRSAIESEGLRYTRFQQHYQGLPVYGRNVVCVTDSSGEILNVTGNAQDVTDVPDLTPSVTARQVQSAVDSLAAGAWTADIAALSDEDLCIYDLDDDGTAHLAYLLRIYDYEILVDAHDGTVLSAAQTILSNAAETGYASSDSERARPITVDRTASGYELRDPVRNITVFDLEQQDSSTLMTIDPDTITSSDNIFGSEDHETADTAARMLYLISSFYDFAETICGADSNWADTYIACNDGFNGGSNACGGSASGDGMTIGIVFTGTNTGVDDVDTLAHEYGHVISRRAVDWTGENVETKAINEAFSDIFGTIAEGWINGWDDPDWDLLGDNIPVHRSLSDPESTGNAVYLSEPADSVRGDGYYYSTLISHAAYLMHADGISELDLVQIWYHALLMMPPDCSFLECRELVELAARNLNYSQEEQQIIRDAFTAVGIVTPDIPNIEIGPRAALNVLDYYGSVYDNYSLRFWRISDQTHGALVTLYPTQCSPAASAYMKTTAPFSVSFTEGVYLLEIKDNADPNVKKLVFLSVTDQGPGHVDIPTAFGAITLDDLMPIFEVFENCNCMYYGVVLNTNDAYRRVFASEADSYEGDFIALAPWDEMSWSASRDALELPVYRVTNFRSVEDVDAHLLQYFTPEFVEEHFRPMMGYRLAMYEGALYWVGHNMGDPPALYYLTAELEASSYRACTVSVEAGYAGYRDEIYTFHFTKTNDGWRMTRWESTYM